MVPSLSYAVEIANKDWKKAMQENNEIVEIVVCTIKSTKKNM